MFLIPNGATQAIQKAIRDGKRCDSACNGATTTKAIAYFPPGKYLVSSSIPVCFGTQMIGDAVNPPTSLATRSFVSLGVLSTDAYEADGGTGPGGNALEWYINTARFYTYVAAIHYQVAQATTIENVEIIADSGTTQQGMYAENGSGGVMSDLTFTGGNFGIYGGSQQSSATRMIFNGSNTAVQLLWDWGWVWKFITVSNAKVGFRLYNNEGGMLPGSVTDTGFTGLVLDNVNLGGQVKDHGRSNQILKAGYFKNYYIGATYENGERAWRMGSMEYKRDSSLLGKSLSGLEVAPYCERPRNQYTDKTAADFIHLKDQGAKGDGSTDDTSAVQNAFDKYGDGSKIVYVDAGTYILKNTVTSPKGAKIVGETWSQFAASGDKFSDPREPIVKVGNEEDVGTVKIQDLILTSKGPTPGVILMEWNVQAKNAGDAALWDVHVCLGGAVGTELTPTECPASKSGTDSPKCEVATILLHITRQASGYFENFWGWVADHQIDDPDLMDILNDLEQLSVYSARGVLIESQKATWLYGTASEHSVYYQYTFHGARNIFTTFLRTESPYYQPTPKPPAPFENAVGVFDSDPSYGYKGGDAKGCNASWAVIMRKCQNIHIGAVGTCSWFSTYTQGCVDSRSCQKSLWFIDDNYDNNRVQQLITIGSQTMIASRNGTSVTPKENLAVTSHPEWAHLSLYEVPSTGPEPVGEPCSNSDKTYFSSDWTSGNIDYLVIRPKYKRHSFEQSSQHDHVPCYRIRHNYQSNTCDFGDIPSGKSRENQADYNQDVGTFTDPNGYANYKIEGTNKTFNAHVTTNMDDLDYQERVWFDLQGMGMGANEYAFPGEIVPATLIIAGSENYGYVSSLELNNYAWKKTILDMYNQLRVGVRYFDIRTSSFKNGEFYGAHVNDELSATPIAALGATLDELIDGTNRFTKDYPDEVIVCEANINEFFDRLQGIDNRCLELDLPTDVTLDTLPIKNFTDANSGKGCVLLLTDGRRASDSFPKDRVNSGICFDPGNLNREDKWADEAWAGDVANQQGRKWQSTQVLVPLQQDAVLESNPSLFHYGVNAMSPDHLPTVILHDAVGLFHVDETFEKYYDATMQTLAIGLNLYMVTQNCKTSPSRNPLAKEPEASLSLVTAPKSKFKAFKGLTFANGTTLDHIPPCPGMVI
ncbi:LysM domain-containing protein [Purpureocillium lavendulum]|uniref:LysM domain-containing protein n=1 Tax=Purpureocillium lavendulum TaxID=1247861 RepID=A0AB34FM61_9HYPO|nr:LysM domain-containing protein [Purpureocillium lavendulum]